MTREQLKKWREKHAVEPAELAALLGVHLATIYRWESGDRDIPPYLPLALEAIEHRRKKTKNRT